MLNFKILKTVIERGKNNLISNKSILTLVSGKYNSITLSTRQIYYFKEYLKAIIMMMQYFMVANEKQMSSTYSFEVQFVTFAEIHNNDN